MTGTGSLSLVQRDAAQHGEYVRAQLDETDGCCELTQLAKTTANHDETIPTPSLTHSFFAGRLRRHERGVGTPPAA